MDINKYIEYVNSNVDNIAKYVNECFEKEKEYIKDEIIKEIRSYLNPLPTHYILEDDGDPYDCSGVIVENGVVSLNQTIKEFLENEYTGLRTPTFVSGHGWNYDTYEDFLGNHTLGLGTGIMLNAIQERIESEFSVNLSDDEFEQIKESCRDFDPIYDDCIASDFFWGIPAVEYIGIENMKLTELKKHKKKK